MFGSLLPVVQSEPLDRAVGYPNPSFHRQLRGPDTPRLGGEFAKREVVPLVLRGLGTKVGIYIFVLSSMRRKRCGALI